MNILSLFDGMSCGQIALERAGIKVDNYFASEIDKYAIQVTMANYPNTIQLGDVTKVHAKDLPKIDLLIGGSPCQGFSFAGKGLNFEDERSKLFFEYVRILNELKPKYFLLENVQMKYEHELVISRYVGCNPIVINSALVSAQNRVRNYWTNINSKPFGMFGDMEADIKQPKDKGIFLKDILEPEVADKYYISEKALQRIFKKNYSSPQINPDKTGALSTRNNSGQLAGDSGTTLIQCVAQRGRNIVDGKRKDYFGAPTEQRLEPNLSGKTNALTSVQKDNLVEIKKPSQGDRVYSSDRKSITINANSGGTAGAGNQLVKNDGMIRRLTEVECERLQTVPDGYTNHVSSTQRYKMLGNGWTVDIVAHILKHIILTP